MPTLIARSTHCQRWLVPLEVDLRLCPGGQGLHYVLCWIPGLARAKPRARVHDCLLNWMIVLWTKVSTESMDHWHQNHPENSSEIHIREPHCQPTETESLLIGPKDRSRWENFGLNSLSSLLGNIALGHCGYSPENNFSLWGLLLNWGFILPFLKGQT